MRPPVLRYPHTPKNSDNGQDTYSRSAISCTYFDEVLDCPKFHVRRQSTLNHDRTKELVERYGFKHLMRYE